jgi:threonine synthase
VAVARAARSSELLDHSGVWRFREMLPILDSFGNAVTLREGNTPLYHLPRAAKALGVDQIYAKHQGMNPTGSFKDTGMTSALSVAKERGFEWVACASTGNTSAAMAAYAARAGMKSLVLIPQGKIAWGKLAQSMDYGAVTCQLKTDFDGCVKVLDHRAGGADLSAELGQSLSAGRAEDAGAGDCRVLRLERAGAHSGAGRQPGQQFGAGQGISRDEGAGADLAAAEDLGDSGGGRESAGAELCARQRRTRWSRWKANTRATAIRIGNPASWRKARVIHETGGWCLDVSEARSPWPRRSWAARASAASLPRR